MKNRTKKRVLHGCGLCIDVVPALVATLIQFPVFVQRSSTATVSASFLILALLCCIPFIKQIKQWLKSPSAWVMWAIFLVIFVLLREIIDEMTIVAFIGAITNFIGAIVYKAGDKIPKEEEEENGTD